MYEKVKKCLSIIELEKNNTVSFFFKMLNQNKDQVFLS